MKKGIKKAEYIWLSLLCTGVVFGCAPNQDAEVSVNSTENGIVEESTPPQETERTQSADASEAADTYFFERQMEENVEQFYEKAEEQGIEWKDAAKYLKVLTDDNLFQDGKMALTGLVLDDIDGNGQMDMLVMVLDAKEEPFYGSGALWFYMNDDEPYCFSEEDCSYYGWFDVFWDDIDNDENVEIVFSAQGTGCGAVGDSYKAVFKYRSQSESGSGKENEKAVLTGKKEDQENAVEAAGSDNKENKKSAVEAVSLDGQDYQKDATEVVGLDNKESQKGTIETVSSGNQESQEKAKEDNGMRIERMQLPSDFESDYDSGIGVEIYQEPEMNRYMAYCPYFDEKRSFRAQNIEEGNLPQASELVGGEVRGFYNLRVAQYEGKKVLQASEYLNGEGGTVHNVATAQFLITWKEDGTPEVIKWWIEEDKNTYANCHESRIDFSGGYFYYANPSDHDYLYRVREDGSKPQCLARVPAENICVRDEAVYFANQGSERGIYYVRADGSGMKKLCGSGHDIQVCAEYVYFCDVYDAAYDTTGLVTEKPAESNDCFLYRMKRDGSARELIDTDVQQYVLSDGRYQEVYHMGSVYNSKYEYINDGDEVELSLARTGLDGQKAEGLIGMRGRVDKGEKKEEVALAVTQLMVYGGKVYCIWTSWRGDNATIYGYDLWEQKSDTISVPAYTDGCIYKGYFYGIEGQQKIYRTALDGEAYEEDCTYLYQEEMSDGIVSDIYATQEGVFFRRFVSGQEGWQWFRIDEDGRAQEWAASAKEI